MPMTRAGLSAVPNVSIAKSSSAGGAESMRSWPTATTGEGTEGNRPASSSPTPSAAPAASNPAPAAAAAEAVAGAGL